MGPFAFVANNQIIQSLSIIITLSIMDDRQQKQKYLRVNILQKQYDAQEFMDFCQNYKGNVDIDQWTLAELQQIVQRFIQSNAKTLQISPFEYKPSAKKEDAFSIDWDSAFIPQAQKPNINLNPIDIDFLMGMGSTNTGSNTQQGKPKNTNSSIGISSLSISAYNPNAFSKPMQLQKQSPRIDSFKQIPSPTPQPQPKMTLVNINVPQYQDETFSTTVKCKTFSKPPRLTSDYQVVVSGHEIVNPNIFIPNFVLYTLTTNPLNVEVKRRMKDFQMFRDVLMKIFPSTQIPHLQRYGRLSQTQPNVIKKQKLFIESFMNSLLMNKDIRCKIIDDFLLCQNLDTMKKLFREYEKIEKAKCIQELYTSSGSISLQYCPLNKKYLSQQQLFHQYLEPNFLKLKSLSDQLIISFSTTVRILQQIQGIYAALQENTKSINNVFPQHLQIRQMETVFQQISEMHKQWALSIKTQGKIMEAEVRHLYRFEIDNLRTIKDVVKNSVDIVEAYQKRSDKDVAGKETYQYNKRLADYKTSVDSSSKNTTVLKYQAAYFQQHAVTECQRYLSELSQKLVKKFKIFSVLELNIGHDLEGAWKEFQKYAEDRQKSHKNTN